jgi:hypothetical protein
MNMAREGKTPRPIMFALLGIIILASTVVNLVMLGNEVVRLSYRRIIHDE